MGGGAKSAGLVLITGCPQEPLTKRGPTGGDRRSCMLVWLYSAHQDQRGIAAGCHLKCPTILAWCSLIHHRAAAADGSPFLRERFFCILGVCTNVAFWAICLCMHATEP